MWVQAGFAPDSFWQQTPMHFQMAIRGVRRRLEMEARARTGLAYESGAFAGLAQHGQLKPLKHYTERDRAETPQEMAARIQEIGARSNMRVRKVRLGKPPQ